jgi:metal-responsive CopG/Arc/MetJ family transcriptional regulator
MPTTVHLPLDLLERVDKRARSLKVSRNQFVRRALDHLLMHETEWSDQFLRALEEAANDEEAHLGVDEMLRAIARRSRKEPPKL